MAKNENETYDSYPRDGFDNPPIGPVGVHRGARSVGARMMPYIVVLIIAALVGALAWGLFSGELTKAFGGGSQTADQSQTVQSANTDSASKNTSSDSSDSKTSSSDGDAANQSSNTDDANSSNTDSSDSQSTQDEQNANDSQNSSDESDQSSAQSQPNKASAVRVVNATGIAGYAASKASVLTGAGYTSVTAANPTGAALPDTTVVWYQNETDKATAEDVAKTLGLTDVQQASGLDVPVVVVLRN
ncbi:LytR C-terminal domain-containing protein [Bifidobacterium jacchi]|uniref:LytR family transcriptional regulator n=1 Tax=Bifidobacterium jacchi TaxID=2490545 RepID=A0A5N5RF74_9BIFI|nr:LytR C-terminal domain-containing protein [Bifidobacterium jacchi]KAB5605883.1 LytR family transcriptional regulator [Bifidobacterium jacchi]